MTLTQYINHYFVLSDILKFLGVAFAGLVFCLTIIICVSSIKLAAKKKSDKNTTSEKTSSKSKIMLNTIDRFYEMIFSGASILSFLSVYYLIDRFVTTGPFRVFWDKHSDMLLLAFIIISCLINTLLDKIFIPLKSLNQSEKASIRLIAMLYIILIFLYIKYIYENNNYDGFIMYFLGLMIGRFVYFDASFKDFIDSVKNTLQNIPLLILTLSYTAYMCYYGFATKYLLKSNGVLVSTFFAHIFMIVSIFIIYHTHIVNLIVSLIFHDKKKNVSKKNVSKKNVLNENITTMNNSAIQDDIVNDNIENNTPTINYNDGDYEDDDYEEDEYEYDDYEK